MEGALPRRGRMRLEKALDIQRASPTKLLYPPSSKGASESCFFSSTRQEGGYRACGARPSGGWPSKLERPYGEIPEMTRKAIFSEGRTLCVRIAEPHGWEGTSLPPVVRREAGGLMGVQEEGARPPQRACGARPSGGWAIQARTALRGNPGYDAKGDFLGGTRSPRPRGRALRMPRHNIIIGGKRTPGGQMGHAPARPIPSERACGARPSAGC